MASALKFDFVLCLSLLLGALGRRAPQRTATFGEVHELVHAICAAICSDAPENSKMTWVFALYASPEYRSSLSFLWSFPNAHMYLAKEPILLKQNDRGIIISWELGEESERSAEAVLNTHLPCGHNYCLKSKESLDTWQLERRVLLQVRDLTVVDDKTSWKILRKLSGMSQHQNYLHFYRNVFVVFGRNNVHSSFVVKRSGLEYANNIRELLAEEFVMEDAMNAFQSIDFVTNRSQTLALNLFAISTSSGNPQLEILLRTCRLVSIMCWKMSGHPLSQEQDLDECDTKTPEHTENGPNSLRSERTLDGSRS